MENCFSHMAPHVWYCLKIILLLSESHIWSVRPLSPSMPGVESCASVAGIHIGRLINFSLILLSLIFTSYEYFFVEAIPYPGPSLKSR